MYDGCGFRTGQENAETERSTTMRNKERSKLILAAAMLGYVPWATAGEKVSYPTRRVANFVVDNLDVTSLPSVFRAMKEKGKKTFAEYGYTTQNL